MDGRLPAPQGHPHVADPGNIDVHPARFLFGRTLLVEAEVPPAETRRDGRVVDKFAGIARKFPANSIHLIEK